MAKALSVFAPYVRMEVPGCPEALIEDTLRRVCIDFCTRTELVSELLSLPTVAEQSTYAVVPTDEEMYPARVRNVLKDGLPLDKDTVDSYTLSDRRTVSGSPERYYAPTHASLVFAPVPAQVETLEVDVVLRPLRTADNVPDVLFEDWLDAIAAGAKAELMSKPGVAWANPALAGYYKGVYDNDVATASVQVAQGNTGAAMHVEAPPI